MSEGRLQKYEGKGLAVIGETIQQMGTSTEVNTEKGLEIGVSTWVSQKGEQGWLFLMLSGIHAAMAGPTVSKVSSRAIQDRLCLRVSRH